MLFLRRPFIAPAVFMLALAVATEAADCQNASNSSPRTASDAATAIADLDAAIVLVSISSHDNFVEVQYKATNVRLFPHTKAEGEDRRLRLTLKFCASPRIAAALKNGVVIHQKLAAPDNSDQFEFTIDQSSCNTVIEDFTANRRDHRESPQPTEPNRVHTLTIRPDQGGEK